MILSIVLIGVGLVFIGNLNKVITVSGIAAETKDGYYLNDYVLTHEEIQKHDANYVWGEYSGQNIEVVAQAQKVTVDCEPYTQCREGTFNVLYDIESIKRE